MATGTQQLGQVHGLAELKELLRKLPADLEKKALRKGARSAANVILAEARRRYGAQFTSRTGKGKKSFAVMVGRRKKGHGVFARIGVRGDAFYLSFLEKGWRHIGRGKGRRARLRSGTIQGKKIPGKPFMEPAFDSKAEEAVRELERAILEYIEALPSK